MTEETKTGEEGDHWMQTKWRPAMGWMYMVVCSFDFVIAPILWSVLQAISKGSVSTQWQPLTLQGAGLFHLAMGAVLGIAAFGRTQEKIAGNASNALNNNQSTFTNFTNTPTINTMQTRPMLRTMQLDPSDPPMRNTRND